MVQVLGSAVELLLHQLLSFHPVVLAPVEGLVPFGCVFALDLFDLLLFAFRSCLDCLLIVDSRVLGLKPGLLSIHMLQSLFLR